MEDVSKYTYEQQQMLKQQMLEQEAYARYLEGLVVEKTQAQELLARMSIFSIYLLSKMWWVLATICLVFGIMGAVHGFFIEKPMYESSCSLMIVKNNMTTFANASDFRASQKAISDSISIIRSNRILDASIERLELQDKYTADIIRKNLRVSFEQESHILTISLRDHSAENAADLVTKIRETFKSYYDELVILDTTEDQFCTPIDTAVISSTPVSPNIPLVIFLYLLFGATLGALIIFVLAFFDDVVKVPEQLILFTGTPVLAELSSFEFEK